jgi:hypothetical protein
LKSPDFVIGAQDSWLKIVKCPKLKKLTETAAKFMNVIKVKSSSKSS